MRPHLTMQLITCQKRGNKIVADVPHHVRTARYFIKKGKALAVYGYYRTWQANGQTHHGFFVRSFTFAKANWGGDGGNTPPLPA